MFFDNNRPASPSLSPTSSPVRPSPPVLSIPESPLTPNGSNYNLKYRPVPESPLTPGGSNLLYRQQHPAAVPQQLLIPRSIKF